MVSYNLSDVSFIKYLDSVLILIVVEDGLVPMFDKVNAELKKVLILIVVEDGLVHLLKKGTLIKVES